MVNLDLVWLSNRAAAKNLPVERSAAWGLYTKKSQSWVSTGP